MLGEVQLTQPCPSSVHGPRSLGVLCLQLLVKYRDCLGDIGDIPQALLDPVFQYCNANQLSAIEDETSIRSASGSFPHAPTPRPCREGRQDEDALDLDIHWQRCYNEDFGHMPQLSQGQTCRQAYMQHLDDLEAKRSRSSQRLRAAWQEETRRRQERTLKVVPVARPIKTIKSHSPHKASGSSAHLRLAKKLGLGKSHARAQHAQQHRRPIQPSAAQRGLKAQSLAFKPKVETTRARLAARNVAGLQSPAAASKRRAASHHGGGVRNMQTHACTVSQMQRPPATAKLKQAPPLPRQDARALVPTDIDWS